jgi:hypothetical protein
LAVAISAAFGGFAHVSHERPPLKVGELDVGEPWNVKIVAARLIGDLEPAAYLKTKGNHWLAIIAEVTITDTRSHTDIERIIRVPTAQGLQVDEAAATGFDKQPYDVLLARDGTRVDALNPGMTERVAFIWEQAADALPTQVDVEIVGMTWRKNFLTHTEEWLDEAVRASLTVPVEDKRNG